MKDKRMILGSFFIFLLTVIIIDLFTGKVLDYLYKKCKAGTANQEYYIINGTHEDILIFGPSTASYHYNSKILQEKLGMSVYNAGREGAGIYFQYGVLLATLERYKPKMIVFDFTFRDLYKRGGGFTSEVLKELAPFYGTINREFDSLLIQTDFDKIRYSSNMLKYNGKFFNILTGVFFSNRSFEKGFTPLQGKLNEMPIVFEEKNLVVDKDLKECLFLFLKRIKKEKIEVYVSISPQLMKFGPDVFQPLYEICNELQVPIINNFSNQKFISDYSLFKDKGHLNSEGSTLFSNMLADTINQIRIANKIIY
jgi:hypothetical protein